MLPSRREEVVNRPSPRTRWEEADVGEDPADQSVRSLSNLRNQEEGVAPLMPPQRWW